MKIKKKLIKIGHSWGIVIPPKIAAEFIPGEEIEVDILVPSDLEKPTVEPEKPQITEKVITTPKEENHEGKRYLWDVKLEKNVWK